MLVRVGEIVRQVALITILAAFLEMLLPERKLTRYVRMVLGLFVIVAILTPLVEALRAGPALDIAAWDLRLDAVAATSVQQGLELAEENQNAALQVYKERLASQIKALVTLVPEVKEAEVLVEVAAGQGYRGAIERVVVIASLMDTGFQKGGGAAPLIEVEKVEVDTGVETEGAGQENRSIPGDQGIDAGEGDKVPPVAGSISSQDSSDTEGQGILPNYTTGTAAGTAPVTAVNSKQIKARIIDMVTHFYSLAPGMVEVQLLS